MKQGVDFSPITKDMEDKLINLISSKDEINWKLCYKLLRSIRGIGRHTAEEWMFVEFKKLRYEYWNSRSKIHDFLVENFKLKHKCGLSAGLDYSYFTNVNRYHGKPLIGMTSTKLNQPSNGKSYKWKLC